MQRIQSLGSLESREGDQTDFPQSEHLTTVESEEPNSPEIDPDTRNGAG